jgi:hypothetical protein
MGERDATYPEPPPLAPRSHSQSAAEPLRAFSSPHYRTAPGETTSAYPGGLAPWCEAPAPTGTWPPSPHHELSGPARYAEVVPPGRAGGRQRSPFDYARAQSTAFRSIDPGLECCSATLLSESYWLIVGASDSFCSISAKIIAQTHHSTTTLSFWKHLFRFFKISELNDVSITRRTTDRRKRPGRVPSRLRSSASPRGR